MPRTATHSRTLCFVISLLCITRLAAGQAPAGSAPPGEQALIADLPVVEAASLHVQNLEEAPANVTIISAADILKYGYRTLSDALNGVRSFDMTYDRMYHYAGVHGFSLPADFNTRFLVMLNGHALTDNVFDSNGAFGQDFGFDMELVQRIEVIRGPSSALYGSNGMFATINVVTKSPVDQRKFRFSSEADSFGEKKALLSSSLYLGHGANLLVSASVFNNRGQTLYFPEYDSPQTHNGVASGVDGERGYHAFANLVWRNWDFVAYFNSRDKQTPIGWDNTSIFGTPGDHVHDERDFIRLLHSSGIGSTGKLRWQVTYDRYRWEGRYDSESEAGIQDERNSARGDWVGSQVDYSFPVPKLGLLTVGTQATWNIRNLQHNYSLSPVLVEQLRVNHPDLQFGLFAQQELTLSARWKAYLGLRFDNRHGLVAGDRVSPRLALVYQPSSKTVYKFVYGRPYRDPSEFEQYYTSSLVLASAPLRSETANTFEVSMERKLGGRMSAIVNVYDYRTHNLIQVAYTDAGLQYRNTDDVKSSGIELELSGKPFGRFEATASFAQQRAVNGSIGDRLPNSPRRVAKLRAAMPLLRDKLLLSSSAQYLGSRDTLDGDSVRPVFLTDVTATTSHVFKQFDFQFGIRNLFDRGYYDPVGHAGRRQIRVRQADLAVTGLSVGHGRSSPRLIRRRNLFGVLASLQLAACLPAADDAPRRGVVIVFVSGIEAYVEAVEGLRTGLASFAPNPVLIDLKSRQAEGQLTRVLDTGLRTVVITVGTEALATVAARKSDDAVIVSTMILRSDRPRSSQGVSAVYLDVPLARLLRELKTLLPGKTRFGMIHNSSRDQPDPSLPARARQQGFTLSSAECSRPEDLVKTFLSLKDKADFVVLLPDSALYNNTTVRPLIQASLESRLPIVGFSSSFVRAGAALGVYPDFRDVGAQTADAVQKLIAGDNVWTDENPRKLQVAVNQRVARLLSLSYHETPALVIFR